MFYVIVFCDPIIAVLYFCFTAFSRPWKSFLPAKFGSGNCWQIFLQVRLALLGLLWFSRCSVTGNLFICVIKCNNAIAKYYKKCIILEHFLIIRTFVTNSIVKEMQYLSGDALSNCVSWSTMHFPVQYSAVQNWSIVPFLKGFCHVGLKINMF